MADEFVSGSVRQNALRDIMFPAIVKNRNIAVERAHASYMSTPVRALFDACLLARATAEDLSTYFGVDPEEYAAYAELFFDVSVFPNDFHVIAYIGALEAGPAKTLLEEAYTQGFSAIRLRYAPSQRVAAVDTGKLLTELLIQDARTYAEYQKMPLNAKTVKEHRSLGKHVVSTAQALEKLNIKDGPKTDKDFEFVLDSAPPNPTIEDLRSKGVEIVH